MSKSHHDQRRHRRKVAGIAKGAQEHGKRAKRRAGRRKRRRGMTKQLTDRELLERVRDRLAKHGWTRGEFFADSGKRCLMGAAGVGSVRVKIARLLLPIVLEQFPEVSKRAGAFNIKHEARIIEDFNDSVALDVTDIEMVLDKAIIKAAEHE